MATDTLHVTCVITCVIFTLKESQIISMIYLLTGTKEMIKSKIDFDSF